MTIKIDSKKRIGLKKYYAIHHWLHKNYGSAVKCENPKCINKSNNFEWALNLDCKYEFKRDNFTMLCKSCHSKLDCTENTREMMRKINIGKKVTKQTREKLRICNQGEKSTNSKLKEYQVLEIRGKYSKDKRNMPALSLEYGVSQFAIYQIIERNTWKHI